jgi:hypothetical protein
VDIGDEVGLRRWWTERLDWEPASFVEDPGSETDESDAVVVDVSFRYHWGRETLEYRVDGTSAGPLTIAEPGGRSLFKIDRPRRGRWLDCGSEAARKVGELLASTSFLRVKHSKGEWRVLVREEGMSHRPSLVLSLTPEEILMYWSLLSPEQREGFLEEKTEAERILPGFPPMKGTRYDTTGTVFDRFAGVYHAFEQLQTHVRQAIDRGEDRAAEALLFGQKYDSLPVLLRKVLDRENPDPVMSYVQFLCAQQLRQGIAKEQSEFWREHRHDAQVLEELLGELPRLRDALPLEDDKERDAFLEWYEAMFVQKAQVESAV